MELLRTKSELRTTLAAHRRAGRTIGLVPTMGYLHDGHASLLRRARERCEIVVMSLFVNPTQFGPGEDLVGYPRDEARDIEVAERCGVDLIFAPSVAEIYPDGYSTSVIVEGLTEVLCGDPNRRGLEHFRGVTTVVGKLFNIVQPDVAVFGQKDAQQVVVVRRMIRDLDYPIELDVMPTVREPDGLAISSRNAFLGPDQRRQAAAIYEALREAQERVAAGEVDAAATLEAARGVLARAGITPEYLEARDADDLGPVSSFNGRPVLIAVAAQLGGTRLIDNVVVETPAGASSAPISGLKDLAHSDGSVG